MVAKQKRPKVVTFLSPPGAAVFPYLNNPDRGQYAKNKEFGNWKTGLRLALADPEVKAFVASLEKAYADSVSSVESAETPKEKAERGDKPLGASRPFKNEFDDAGNPTGYVVVNFKRSGGGRDEKDPSRTWVNNVGLFDAQNNKIDRARVRIGGGSRIIVNYSIDPFATQIGAGISLKLWGVQVLERMDAPERDAVQYGFQKQAGFVDDSEDAPDASDDTGSTTSAVGSAKPGDDDV